ncbi:hypothetical protein LR68_00961 [Anoxybacillus sp. BCO1]|nr:hypothetical protein LR68_00961 [Anoxybacillus sp. BCO1]
MMNGIQQTVTHSLDMNEQTLRDYFTKTPDLIYCHLFIGEPKKRALLIYLNTLVDKNSINNNIIDPLLFETKTNSHDCGYSTANRLKIIYDKMGTCHSTSVSRGNRAIPRR